MSLQPRLATKDVLILVFMFMLWGYSLYLTYRAWYKLLYSGGEDSGTNMWRWVATWAWSLTRPALHRYILDMVTLKKRNETRRKTLIDTEVCLLYKKSSRKHWLRLLISAPQGYQHVSNSMKSIKLWRPSRIHFNIYYTYYQSWS